MFSRLHNKLGTAGLIVAVIALVAALTGAAFAAGGLTKQQEKQVKKLVKKYSKPGPAGPAGAPGAKGDTGAKGDQGPKGDAGAEGKQGIPGEDGEPGEDGFCSAAEPECVAPSGATFTGTWAVSGAGAPGERAVFAFSYPMRIPSLGDPNLQVKVVPPGEPGTPDCPGSNGSPAAEPGFVCLYEFQSINAEGIEASAGALNNVGNNDFSSGVVLRADPETEGEPLRADGTWAVTVPES